VTPIPIKEAIVESGGVTALALKLHVTRQTVHRWLRAGENLPEPYHYTYIAKRPRKRP
jgi:DNA invertase Pin-like site-specific DNA recombinase